MLRAQLLLGFLLSLFSPFAAAAAEGGAPPASPAPSAAGPVVINIVQPASAPPVPSVAVPSTASPGASANGLPAASGTHASAQTAAPKEEDGSAGPFTFAMIAMTVFAAVSLLSFVRSLSRSRTWSLGDALSEEAGNQPTLPAGMRPVMVASASRTIALFGLFVLMSVVLGIGYYIVWALFHDRDLAGLDKILPFFYGSAAIFAPYAINQLKEAFGALAGAGTAAHGTNQVAAPAVAPAPGQPVVIPPALPQPQVVVQPISIAPASTKA